MQSLRIAVGLFVLVLTLLLLSPVQPTLLGGRDAGQGATVAQAETAPPATIAALPEPMPAAPVRAVGPVPVETAALKRLPPAASGAATPPVVGETPPAEASADVPAADAGEAPAAPVEVAAAAPAPGAPAPDGSAYRLFARPIAVDAGTLKAGEFTLTIAGVAPVAGDMRCADGAQTWPCAVRARTALRGWIRGRSVLCAVAPEAAEAREINAPCLLGEEDVGEWVVRNGWAQSVPGSRYEAAEREAREARRGIWAYGLAEEAAARSGG